MKGKEKTFCNECIAWIRVSDQDGGIGVCDNRKSSHDQHILGHAHFGCKQFRK